MPLYGDEESALSLGLVEFLSKSAREFCKEKGLLEEIIPDLLSCKNLEKFARGLKLRVEVKSCFLPRPEGLDIALNPNYEQSSNLIVL